jgi:uncharacterized protein (TIGR02453 family)
MPLMPTSFPGFSSKAVTFLRRLAKHNDRAWFAAHKDEYQLVLHDPMVELVGRLNDFFRRLDADYVCEPKRAMYRIHRDTRFSKDKTPYKTMLGAQFQHPKVTKNLGAGFYFHVSVTEFMIAGGIYMPGPDELAAWRNAMNAKENEFRKLLADKSLRRLFPKVGQARAARIPKGFEKCTTAEDLVRLKQLCFYLELPPAAACENTTQKQIETHFKVLHPIIQFINDAIVAELAKQADDTGPRRPAPMF